MHFPLGQTVITPGAIAVLANTDVLNALARHVACDWGDVCGDDRLANDEALRTGARLLSASRDCEGVKFWIITEANRSVTTVLLPEEY